MASLKRSGRIMRDSEMSARCNEAIARLVELKINFLALDFDQTILDIHTGGVWKGTPTELSQHVRPLFRHLITSAISANIKVAVVTFSSQVAHIEEVLEIVFSPAIAESIPIRGRDRSWSYNGAGCKEGKQSHMASAVEELEGRNADLEISKNTTLLIDDDPNNIKIALHDGVRAIWLNPSNSTRLLKDMNRLT
eukprot:CAMPEP_0172494806 /NCGR_PEP_ID=MMETSP1066-20121228/57445_1 /TAXON_ID=671091 /ORGANISM="Coscinodiscus wailesii, Strain CCMP2513" /LENGTH=193 /DNA_ID=CAMNT_0013266079 /DNA_START=82 /DNA_END=663 /DNA_ORIENTATION=+